MWTDDALLADPWPEEAVAAAPASDDAARALLTAVADALGLPAAQVRPAFEDPLSCLAAAVRQPAGLPVDPRAAYFVPRRSGPFWDAIRDAGAMALFTPSEFADAEFELLAPTPG